MTVDGLKILREKLKEEKKLSITPEQLEQIGEGLRFSASIDSQFITEVNLFVHLLHKKLSKVEYYGEIEENLEIICSLSLGLAESLKVIYAKPKEKQIIPQKLIDNMKRIGKLLQDVAPHIRTITGILSIIHQSDIHFFN